MVRLASILSASLLALAFLCSLPLSRAHAQRARCGAPETITDAQALYECGTRALGAEDFASAERYLAASLEREPSVRTAFNLAIALRNLGQARRALDLLREIEAGRHGEVPAERRDSLARQIETNLASLATVVVTLPPGVERATVELDGVEDRQLESPDAEARFVVEPGTHAILASGPSVCFERAPFSVSRGDSRAISLTTTACAETSPRVLEAASIAPDSTTERGDDGVLIGVAFGVGIALVAGAIVLGVVLGSGQDAAVCEPSSPCIQTLLAPASYPHLPVLARF